MTHSESPLHEVLTFWFEELTPGDWFKGGEELDATIRERFSALHARVAANEFWRQRIDSRMLLAEVIVLDQFSRQIYRDSAQAFAYDGQALAFAQQAITAGFDVEYSADEKQFLYLPFMHSESARIHEDALVFFEALGNEESLKFEKIHQDIIDRFGRYPHRNKALGRETTAEEADYLAHNQEAFF